jgi:hypothetical protein
MDAYIWQASLICEECGEALLDSLRHCPDEMERLDGPYSDGGGESDAPEHCAHCHEYLANPLTSEGVEYALTAIENEALDLEAANRIMPRLGTAEESPDFAYWHGSPHKAIVLEWADDLQWYGLNDEQEARLERAVELLTKGD